MTNQENKIMGQQIAKLRMKHGMTQPQLGDKLDVSRQTISNWEHGIKSPRMGTLQRMSDLFNVSIGEITDPQDKKDKEAQKRIDLADALDNHEYMTYQGKPIDPEDLELIKRILRNK